MARVFIDGFESGSIDLWTATSGQATTRAGMDGSYCGRYLNGYKVLPALSAYYLGFKYILDYGGTHNPIIFKNGTTALGELRINSTSALFMFCNSANPTTALATGVTPLVGANIFHNIEWYYLPRSDGTGRSILKVNGITQFDYTGVSAPSTSDIDRLHVVTYDDYIDNIVVDDSAWPGTTRIQAIWPTAAGANSGFTPSVDAVANYTMVDERPASDTDYVRTNTSDAIDTYTMSNFVPPEADVPWKIKCIQPQARAMYEGISAVTQLNMAVKTGGTVYESASLPLTTIWSGVGAVMEQNPNTSVDWTVSDIDGLEAGYRAKI